MASSIECQVTWWPRVRVAAGSWRQLTALVTLVAFTAPIITPALAAAQPSGEPIEQVSASDWALPDHTFELAPTIQPDVDAPVGGTTRDPSLHAPDDAPDPTLGPVNVDERDDYEVSPGDGVDRMVDPGAAGDPVETTELPTGADKSGVTSKAISVPKGSGTIEGMGESFSAQLSTGIATFSVPFALPAARGGAQPSLGLSYSSSGGFGAAGVGWSLGVPFIARQTDRGLPKYLDEADWHPEQDRFVFNGGQELVPICTVGEALDCGEALPDEEMPPWSAGHQYFRARVEGSFLRFFWSPDHRTWRVQDKSGVTMELGVPLDGSDDRTALEVNPDNEREIYRWNLVRQYDTHGDANPASGMPAPNNVVVYKYTQDGETAYLSDIFATGPAGDPTPAELGEYAHHTRVRWEPRSDRTESYRSGWRMQQRLRVQGVDVTSKTISDPSSERRLVRRYHLAYDPDSHVSLLERVQVEGRCASREIDAPAEDGSGGLGATSCERLPPMTFGYERVEGSATLPGHEAINEQLVEVESAPDHSIDEALTDFFDVNSDSLADILVTAPGLYNDGHAFFQNGAGGVLDRFGGPTEIGIEGVLGANANTIRLTNLNVVPLDVDGDGHVNLLHMPRVKSYSLYSPVRMGSQWLWQGRIVDTASGQDPKIDFGNDTLDTETADVDFDGLVDVVVSSGTEFQTFFSLGRYPNGDGQFGSAEFTGAATSSISNDPVTTCVPWAGSPVRFSDGDTHLADMNGDGIVDIARVRRGDIRYWPGRGNGFWGTGERGDCPAGGFGEDRYVAMADSPHYSDIQGTTLRLDDVNGDGLTDLVQVRFDEVDIFLNVNGEGWTDRHIIPNTPASPSYANRVRLVDINGSGTRDIVWGSAENYRYIDLAGGKRPWVLTHVDNGLGKTTELEYSTSAHEMLAAEQNGECSSTLRGQAPEHGPIDYQAAGVDPWSTGWCQKMPTLVHLVKRVTESDNITVAGRPPAAYITEYEYRDPLYEGRQREFRGFERARARRIGDANSPTDISESVFMLGECVDETVEDRDNGVDDCSYPERWRDNVREALKGLPLVSEKYDENGTYLSSTFNAYTLRTLYTGLDGRLVRHAFLSQTDAVAYDTGPFIPGNASITMGDLEVEHAPSATEHAVFAEATLRSANYAQVRSTNEVDGFGNQTLAVAHGCVAGNGCPPTTGPDFGPAERIQSHTTPDRPDDDVTGWLWRTVESYVDSSEHATPRNYTRTEHDERGRVTHQYITVYDVGLLDRFHDTAGRAVAPPPANLQAEGVEYNISQVLYDEFGNATQTKVPDFGRCARVGYGEDPYQQLPTSEIIFLKPDVSEPECTGDETLTTVAVYDRGLGVVTTAADFNQQITRADYDSFGRVTALFQPDPENPGNPVEHPSVVIAYHLPPDLGDGARHSVIHTQTQDGSATDNYLQSYAYVDGFGRNIMALAEADSASPDDGGDGAQWIVGNLLEYDNKSAVRRKYLEFYWNGDPLTYPFESAPTTHYGRQRYDAFGRQVQTFDLDGTVTLQSVYHALGTDLWDAADLENGPHHNSFASELKDGHGRTVQTTERFRHDGTLEQRHVRTRYLPTGEPELITRARANSSSSPNVTRWMQYDSHGRMVVNVEPNTTANYVNWAANSTLRTTISGSTKPWRYAYNALGELLGTSDARGCGQNFYYDHVGRLIAEDYSPCEEHHTDYTEIPPTADLSTPDDASGAEVYYLYDEQIASDAMPDSCGSGYLKGRTVAVFDRASVTKSVYDPRGRVTESCLRVANPNATNDDIPERYAGRTYKKSITYDIADREIAATTGLESGPSLDADLLGGDGQSRITTQYTARGTVKSVGGSYGSLVDNIQRTADGLMQQMRYGDAADTTTAYSYDQRRRLSSVQTYRGPPASGVGWGGAYQRVPPPSGDAPSSFQLLLQDETFTYDIVGNPTEIRDWRDPAEWPEAAKPVSKKIQYDDLYRATRVDYQYTTGDDEWISPFHYENEGYSDPRRADPAPHQDFDKRILQQTFRYDWLGNSDHTDDDAHGFYDRSLGTITNGTDQPYQLQAAAQSSGTHSGNLTAEYDPAGNLTRLSVNRNSTTCLPQGADCDQVYEYEWDEVGRLVRARRYDAGGQELAADLGYYYDASDQRVIKRATFAGGEGNAEHRYTVYLFDTLELRRAEFGLAGVGDYDYTEDTAVPYLLANGVRLARVMWEINPLPSIDAGQAHVFFELGDHLGSTSVVLDQATGELVERATFQAYGGAESDYRPERWAGFREDYRFTGKEEDVEVGLQYFGKRFLNPLLGRWMSADPLSVHLPGEADWNLYAYVSGGVLMSIDPLGLCEEGAGGACPGEGGAEGASHSDGADRDQGASQSWFMEENDRLTENGTLTPEEVDRKIAWEKDVRAHHTDLHAAKMYGAISEYIDHKLREKPLPQVRDNEIGLDGAKVIVGIRTVRPGKQVVPKAVPTDAELQAIADEVHAVLEGPASHRRTTYIHVHADGHLSATGSQKPNPAQREVLAEHGITDVPPHGQTTRAPGPTGHHAEQRGIQHGENINNPVVRQAGSSGAKHGGKSCADCAAAQDNNGVKGVTGKQ